MSLWITAPDLWIELFPIDGNSWARNRLFPIRGNSREQFTRKVALTCENTCSRLPGTGVPTGSSAELFPFPPLYSGNRGTARNRERPK